MSQTVLKKVVIDDAVPFAQEIFGHLGKLHLLPGKAIQADDVKDAQALIIRSRTQINKALLENSDVKFVGSTVVGLDHVDQNYLQTAGIKFYSAQGCNANSVAEFVINALFELAEAKGFDLSQKTLGIIGVGNVGSRLFTKAEQLNIKCLVNDPPKQLNEPEAYEYRALDEVLKADIISVHTPLTTEGPFATQNLISAQKLSQIQPHQIIVNAARGGIIDEHAWINTQTLANIIDCWVNEPHIHSELYKTAFFATPHIAGHSFEAKLAGSEMVYQALCDFQKTSPKTDWKKILPAPSTPIEQKNLCLENSQLAKFKQTLLRDIFRKCHDIFSDHNGISAKTHQEIEKKYEFFRRNYPIYHEWHQHKVVSLKNKELDNLLKSLGFQIIQNKK